MPNITRKEFIKQSAAGGLALGLSSVGFPGLNLSKQDRPNLVLFLTDDHAKMDSGCYGNEVIRTPGMDRLASEGMKFNNAFSITATCTPSRCSIYTGLGPFRHGSHENHSQLKPNLKTLPHHLKKLGYRVLLAGKTHIKPLSAFPFEYIDTEGDWQDVIVEEGSEVEQFLSTSEAKDRPFCLVIATNNPHVPWPLEADYNPDDVKLHPYLLDTPDTRKAMANYYTDVSAMDRELQMTLDLLDTNDLAVNTAVMFASDQGPQFPHAKWELYNYGMNIPFIVRWPDKVKAGATSNAMLSTVDILPTFIEMAGGSPPADIDGQSFADVLAGDTNHHREIVYGTHTRDGMMNYYPIKAIRTDRYKYIWNLFPERAFTNHITNSNQFAERGGEQLWDSWMRLAATDATARERVKNYQHRPEEELYDITKDPAELNNLAGDSEYREIKQKLRTGLEAWMDSQGDTGKNEWINE